MISPSVSELFNIGTKYFVNYKPHLKEFEKLDISTWPSIVNSEKFIGIEVEMEKVGKLIPGSYLKLWSLRTDGSLRGSGMEAVSVPVQGIWIKYALKSLFDQIKSVHFSQRTSIHIHLDIMKLTTDQITMFLLVYLSVESLLYRFIGKDRELSIYCVPLYNTYLPNSLVQFMNNSFHNYNFSHMRYAGLNLDSIRKFGTIEFRHLHGTNDLSKIINWINLIFKLYEFSLKFDFNTLVNKITELNTTSYYIAYLNEIFEEIVGLLDIIDIKHDLEKGVKAVKQSLISNKFLKELQKEININSPALERYLKFLLLKGKKIQVIT